MVIELVLLWIQCRPMPRVSDVISSVGAGMASQFARYAVDISPSYIWSTSPFDFVRLLCQGFGAIKVKSRLMHALRSMVSTPCCPLNIKRNIASIANTAFHSNTVKTLTNQ